MAGVTEKPKAGEAEAAAPAQVPAGVPPQPQAVAAPPPPATEALPGPTDDAGGWTEVPEEPPVGKKGRKAKRAAAPEERKVAGTLSTLDRFAYTLLGARAAKSKRLEGLDEQLRKAQMPVRAEAYLAKCWLNAGISAVAGLFVGILAMTMLTLLYEVDVVLWVLVLFFPPLFGYVAFVALVATPGSKAKARKKNIDQRMPYATNYMAAMASAGVIPSQIFRSLAKQHIYGEVAKEAAMIYKDLEVHGKDIVTALRRAIDRTPSIKFQELLQGAITTTTSGGDLTAYFRQKATRYQWENRVEQKTFVETMGLMAETYVTAAVAGPLFLLVMVAIIVLMGAGTMDQIQMIVFVLLPVINGGFAWGLLKMIPEV